MKVVFDNVLSAILVQHLEESPKQTLDPFILSLNMMKLVLLLDKSLFQLSKKKELGWVWRVGNYFDLFWIFLLKKPKIVVLWFLRIFKHKEWKRL